MPPITFSGLASGLDTKAMIEAILSLERKPLERLEERQQVFNQRKSAFDELRSKLNDFESALRDLASSRKFRGRAATVSDESILRATPGTGAETGNFELEVLSLASASKVKSDGFIASDQGLVSDGTITLQAGDNDAITIDVSSVTGNNSLEVIRDTINGADAGIQAAILFDGSDYLLTVRSEETGTENALTVTDTTSLNLADAGNEINAATDAQIRIDGANGITVTSASNKITGVIPGVTLDLLSETDGTPITVDISQDNDGVVEAVQDLVGKYNEVADFFNQQFNRDNPGVLAGDGTARLIQTRIQSLFTGGVDGIPFGDVRSLSAVGVSFDGETGKANLDAAKLREVLDTNFDQVGNLFLSSGRTSDFRIGFFASSNETVAGTYAVEVTQAAEQASVVGRRAINSLQNDETLTITVGTESTTVDLAKNDQTADVVDKINAQLRADGIRATASDDGGAVRISTQDFGSAAEITVQSSRNNPPNGRNTGFDDTPASDTGLDVTGSIGGVEATGNGQILTAAEGSDPAGLQLKVTASAAAVADTGGDFGTVSFSRGLMDSVIGVVDQFTKYGNGTLDVVRESLQSSIKSLDRDIDRVSERLIVRETYLVRTFARAEQAIAALNAQQGAFGAFNVF